MRCLSAVLAAFFLPVALAGCGGSSSPEHRDSEQAARKFDAADLPSLTECLAKIGSTLEKRGGQEQLGIACAVATYVGRTPDGYDCSLKVDNDPAEVRMQVGRDREITIPIGVSAFSVEGRPILNVQDASSPGQPGIQVMRYTPGIGAGSSTETLSLRMGGGRPNLPTMVYSTTTTNQSQFTVCNSGR